MTRRPPLFPFLVLALVGGSAAAAIAGASPWLAVALLALAGLGAGTAFLSFRDLPDLRADELTRGLDDVAARIEAAGEQRLVVRRRAEAAGRFREEFVAAVRHELKTPLNAIQGFTEVLLQGVDGPLNPQQREDVDAIREAGLYLRELVESVLSEWVPDRETPLPLSRVDTCGLAEDVVRLLRGQVAGRPIEVRALLPEGETPVVVGDTRRLRQILINLGTNALRATRAGSVTIQVTRDAAGVRFTVRDTGSGIAATDLPHLFSEFEQVGAEDQPGGSGLGLALTRDMVEWHEGRIEVETRLGEGTAFHVILPSELD